jgi:cell division protein FtsI/penicillin-binding protein 2
MISFFKRRPGTSVVLTLVMFVGGGILAHQSGTSRIPMAATLRAKPRLHPKKDPPGWRQRIDLSHARLEGNRLVQVLPRGARITFTLDPDLQQWATAYLRDFELPYGAMFLYELDTGATLVMAGYSAHNAEMSAEDLCLAPWAPAASVFKLVTTTALLENGVPANTTVCYHGGLHGLRARHLKDDPDRDTTCKSLSYAVSKSVNPVVGKLTLRYLDKRALSRWSRRFGFNRSIRFELPVQPSRAEIPSKDLELARVASGFWHTEVSALHGAVIGGVAGNHGMLRWPHLVANVRDRNGGEEIPERPRLERVMRRRHADALARAMVNTTVIGTARKGFFSRRGRPFLGDIEVAGKTGSLSRKKPFLHYNWFVGYAPAGKPKVAVAALLGNPARWRIKAHTAARMLLDRYFRSLKKPEPVAAGAGLKPVARGPR